MTMLPTWSTYVTNGAVNGVAGAGKKYDYYVCSCDRLEDMEAKSSWHQREAVLFWRGLDRDGSPQARSFFGDSLSLTEFPSERHLHPRYVFPKLSLQYPELLNVYVCGNHLQGNLSGTASARWEGLVREYVEWPAYIAHRYLLYLPGNECSGRLPFLFLSGNLVFVVSDWIVEEVVLRLVRPWEHFIPVRADGSDVVAKVRWAIKNDAMARSIAQAGLLRMRNLLSCGSVLKFTAMAISLYASVYDAEGPATNSSYIQPDILIGGRYVNVSQLRCP